MATPVFGGAAYDLLISSLIFIFLFSILYALINKVEFFGDNKTVHAFIAFSSALLIVFIPETKELINFMTPWFVIFIILIVFILLAVMTLGIKGTEISDWLRNVSPGTTTFVIILVVVIFLFSMYHVFGNIFAVPVAGEMGGWAAIKRVALQPKILGVIFLLIMASIIVKTIGFKHK